MIVQSTPDYLVDGLLIYRSAVQCHKDIERTKIMGTEYSGMVEEWQHQLNIVTLGNKQIANEAVLSI